MSGKCPPVAARRVRRCYVVAAAASYPLSSWRRVLAAAAAAAPGPTAAQEGLTHCATGTHPRDDRVKKSCFYNITHTDGL